MLKHKLTVSMCFCTSLPSQVTKQGTTLKTKINTLVDQMKGKAKRGIGREEKAVRKAGRRQIIREEKNGSSRNSYSGFDLL